MRTTSCADNMLCEQKTMRAKTMRAMTTPAWNTAPQRAQILVRLGVVLELGVSLSGQRLLPSRRCAAGVVQPVGGSCTAAHTAAAFGGTAGRRARTVASADGLLRDILPLCIHDNGLVHRNVSYEPASMIMPSVDNWGDLCSDVLFKVRSA